MLEKLDLEKRNGFGPLDWLAKWNEPSGAKLIEAKVNQLIDAVNELQEWVDTADKHLATLMEDSTRAENVQDKFAQYRDWAGKLCRFWDIDKDKAIYGILEEVKADWAYRFQMKGENYLFDHCEPVKPDSEIIYHGE